MKEKFTPTAEQKMFVRMASAGGIPHADIATCVIDPATDTLIDALMFTEHFQRELNSGHTEAATRVVAALYKSALEGDTAAQIWWTKAHLGWKTAATSAAADETAPRPLREQPWAKAEHDEETLQ